jgi:hypothetical protein
MALRSRLFARDVKLNAAAVSNSAHIAPGASGAHVGKLQRALILLDDARISTHDLRFGHYGLSTAQAVLSYKTKRQIINTSYQTRADNIVGIMTMAALDAEMVKRESHVVPSYGCGDPGRSRRAAAPVMIAVGSRATLAFGISERFAGSVTLPIFSADLSVVMMWTTASLTDPDSTKSREWNYFSKAREVLKPFSININTLASPAEVPSNVLVDPGDKRDIWSVRKTAEQVMPGQREVLRIIGCPFERTDPLFFAVTESGMVDGVEFVDFILLNTRLTKPDQCTVVHEMLHADSRADGKPTPLINRWLHDVDKTSIYSDGDNRTVLKPEYAQALSESFFARAQ